MRRDRRTDGPPRPSHTERSSSIPEIVAGDLPEEYVRFLYGTRVNRETQVFSRPDALLRAAPQRSPRRGRTPNRSRKRS